MAVEAVLTFAAEGILEKVLSLAEKEFSLAWGFKAELRKLKESFTTIELLLNDVAYKPQAPAIEEWVKKLKGVAEDAEDVLDEFKYEVDRRKVEIQNHIKKKVLNFFSLSNPLAFRLKMAHKIQKINASLVDLETEASITLRLIPVNRDATPHGITGDRRTDSLFGGDEITVGREDDVSNIVKTLTDSKSNQENLAVMAIVGMGGLGKTTLAKSVYNEDSIQKFFDKRIWICVSNPFDVNLILLHMLEHLNPAKAPSKDNKNALLEFLKEELKNKKYLLVLDDVWNEDSKMWDNLTECLSKLNSVGGSKIIVTTRSGKVASILKKLILQHELGELSVDECWSIMKDKAFPINGAPEFNSNASMFETIGKEIAKNCGGVPLVAKVLGGILHTKKSIQEWSSFKNSRVWNNQLKEGDRIMPILRLSFDNLESPSLKQCFAYCSMFKKDVIIQRENLIQLWMAQGLLHPLPGGIKDMEDIGNEYFDILLQSSLFQDATMSDNGIVRKCKMHDLVHDLAEHLFKSEGLMGDLCGIDNTLEIRHVARVSTSTLEKIPKRSAEKLRSLFFYDGEVLTNILPRFKCLRVLNLSNASIEEYTVSVGRLKHLRYLDISYTRFKALPESIGKLYNLQTLRAVKCALEAFPKDLKNLINLRHICFDKDIEFPEGIGQLTSLRTLPYFSVGSEIGRRIEELAGLKQLKGELVVRNLEHVKNGEEAKKAKLEDKTKVTHLSLEWTRDRSTTDNNEDEDVLQGLRPHCELESLSIENFMGNKFPPWMMSESLLLNNLKKIELLGCHKCEGVPPLGHLPNLTELEIRKMANLKCVGAEFYGYGLVDNVATTSKGTIDLFPALKVLCIYDCGDLIEWMEAPLMSAIMVFPCLERLVIRDCVKLRHLPDGLDTLPLLKELTIKGCPSLELIPITQGMASLCKLTISGCEQLSRPPSGLEYCTALRELVISNCNGLLGPLRVWASLVELDIKFCNNLTSIEMKGSVSLTASLQKLSIKSCNGLSGPMSLWASLVKVSIQICNGLSGSLSVWASLVELDIRNCNNLTSIEMKGSGSLTPSLQKWTIGNCRELTSIPALPQQCPSLQELWIWNCPKLSWFGVKSSRVEKEEEEECPKLASFCARSSRIDEEECISLQSTSDLRTITSLRLLSIRNCERLESWVSSLQFPLSLETLAIRDIPNLEILPSLDHLHSLRSLSIVSWRNLKYLPTGLQWPTGLETLSIGGFWEELDSFPDFEVGSLMHLTSLYLYGWPKLKSLPQQIQHLTSLTDLSVHEIDGVETLPEWLGSLTSLTYLYIRDCKNLMNLPSVQAMQRLTKLRTLWIFGCHPLLEERCRRGSGTDWPKISHIPDLRILG